MIAYALAVGLQGGACPSTDRRPLLEQALQCFLYHNSLGVVQWPTHHVTRQRHSAKTSWKGWRVSAEDVAVDLHSM